MKKKIIIGFVFLGTIMVSLVLFLLSSVAIPKTSNFKINLKDIQNLAREGEGQLPIRFNAIHVVTSHVPELFVTSFRGIEQHTFHTYSYQIVFQDKTIMIDAVTDHKTAEAILPGSIEQPGQYDRMQLGLRQASSVVFTHEHFDHCSGIATSPYFNEISPRIHFTTEQMPGLGLPKPENSGFTPEVIGKLSPVLYQDLYKLAPGVVLIKAPSHTPGSQMIYIQLESGEEFLLVGDIAWHMDNITKPKHHPRFISFLSGEEKEKNVHLLRWLHNLDRDIPKLHIVVAHDGEQMDGYVAAGLIGPDLEIKTSKSEPINAIP